MKLYTIVLKTFAKVVSIPPRLKIKNPKPVDNKALNPVYNLLKSEKFSENKNETFNSLEKNTYEHLIISSSKNLLTNYYKLYDTEQEKHIENLYKFLNESLSVKEINLFISHLNEAKNIIDSVNIEKNEKIFTMFLDKLFILTERKSITYLIQI
jgi:hypothetical protein